MISRRNLIIGVGSGLVAPLSILPNEANALTYKANSRGDLYHDSDNVVLARMLFGEGRSVSVGERIAIGFTPINRQKRLVEKSLTEIILHPGRYHCFNSHPEDPNFKKVLDPEEYDSNAWEKSLKIAKVILNGKYDGVNFGQTHYHRKDSHPKWAKHMIEKLDSTGYVHQFYRGV
jgi:spore germination cell wall hydrolase CwlJ-like protein|tara:strand:- start:5887 stop:6411 length:525 start_codon:yes stop_codon:yes gene_type:complete